ncbi:MAG: hypothetical protein GX567_17575 [Clostridia bacterium]|nr:hypothetical protein [Clostridia bacterium]
MSKKETEEMKEEINEEMKEDCNEKNKETNEETKETTSEEVKDDTKTEQKEVKAVEKKHHEKKKEEIKAVYEDSIESIQSNDTKVLAKLLNEIREDNEKQMNYLKKQLRVSQFFTVFLVVILTIVIFQIISVIPKVNGLLAQTETMMTDAQAVMKNIDTVTKELTEADIAGMLEDVDSLVVSSETSMADAMNQVMAIDIESLNQAIKDLQSVVAPLAKLFGRR